MMNGYEMLVEKEAMFAQMVTQVLQDNEIPCTVLPVNGAGFAIKTGVQERVRVYVPAERLKQAKELLYELFPTEYAVDEGETQCFVET